MNASTVYTSRVQLRHGLFVDLEGFQVVRSAFLVGLWVRAARAVGIKDTPDFPKTLQGPSSKQVTAELGKLRSKLLYSGPEPDKHPQFQFYPDGDLGSGIHLAQPRAGEEGAGFAMLLTLL